MKNGKKRCRGRGESAILAGLKMLKVKSQKAAGIWCLHLPDNGER